MGDIAHHYIIYNMKSRCDFGAYGEISATGENWFETSKFAFLHVERRKTAEIKKKCTFFALFVEIFCWY